MKPANFSKILKNTNIEFLGPSAKSINMLRHKFGTEVNHMKMDDATFESVSRAMNTSSRQLRQSYNDDTKVQKMAAGLNIAAEMFGTHSS